MRKRTERGAVLAEYGILFAGVVAAAIVVVGLLTTWVIGRARDVTRDTPPVTVSQVVDGLGEP